MNLLRKIYLVIFCLLSLTALNGAPAKHTELVLFSGDYRAELESRFAWTVHKLDFRNKPVLVGSGWMGAVIKNKVPKGQEPFVGTGHGGEIVKSLKILVDGREVKLTGVKSQSLRGQIIKVLKESVIGPLAHKSTITLTPQGLEQSFHFQVVGDTAKLLNMYMFMSIWDKPYSRWLTFSGQLNKGTFKHGNKFIDTGLTDWIGVFNPGTGIAGVCVYRLPERFNSFFWDRRVDNKHYIKYYPVKKHGAEFSGTAFISAFQTTSGAFAGDAEKQAAVIRKSLSDSNIRKIGKNAGESEIAAVEKEILKKIPGPLPFKIRYPVADGKVANAADFGLIEKGAPQANTVALQKALDYCRKNNIHKLIVPQGKYNFLKTTVDQRDQGKEYNHYTRRIYTLNLIGMKDFIFDGQGSEFIFEDLNLPRGKEILGGFFRILECERVQLKNFTIDWNWDRMPLGFKGRIVNVNPDKLTVDYKVSYNGKPIPDDFHVYAVRGWEPAINNRTTKSFNFYWRIAQSHKMIGPDILRFSFRDKAQMRGAKPGMWAIFKSKTHFFAVGIIVDENNDVSIDNIKIYGVPSSAINGRRNKSLEITNCKVMPRPGTEKVWASHSGFEIHNSLGYFKMANNYLEFTHDDALHFSSYFLGGGFKRINDNTLRILDLMYWQAADAFIVGDTYEFFNRDFSPTGFKAKLQSFKWTFVEGKGQAKHYVTAVFDRAIPKNINNQAIIFNTSSYGSGQFYICDNTIKNGLCHGLYIGEPNGIIENNRILNTAYPALVVHSVIRWKRWHIGYPPRNIIIRNNSIENCDTALRPPADVFIGGGIDPQKDDYFPGTYPVAKNILLTGNTIRNSQWQPLAVWSAENIIVRNNKFINPNRLPSKKNYGGTICLDHAKNVIIAGNQCIDDGNARDNGIAVRQGLCRNIMVGDNSGM